MPAVVDEVSARLIAAVVVVLGALALATGQWWIYAALFLDFTLRAGWGPRRSPVARAVAAWIRPRVPHPARPTAFAPKRFAAWIGAGMTATITVLWAVHALTGAQAPLAVAAGLALVMIVLPALEAGLGFCLGCRIFALLVRAGVLSQDVCVDCVQPARTA